MQRLDNFTETLAQAEETECGKRFKLAELDKIFRGFQTRMVYLKHVI